MVVYNILTLISMIGALLVALSVAKSVQAERSALDVIKWAIVSVPMALVIVPFVGGYIILALLNRSNGPAETPSK